MTDSNPTPQTQGGAAQDASDTQEGPIRATDPLATTATQDEVSSEMREIEQRYRSGVAAGAPVESGARIDYAPYRSSLLRHPTKSLTIADPEIIELHSPAFGHRDVSWVESDLTIQHNGEPLGERMVVAGRLLDSEGRPVPGQLIEVWQANSAGRYVHKRDQHPAPLDPNFTGTGRAITDEDGNYRFQTIKPGPYPWRNHSNAWRPAHIHFSVFGTAITQRIVTQMYFPSDPLFALDPIYQSIVDKDARDRLIASYDHSLTSPEWALGYRWDIVLNGTKRTWTEPEDGDH